MSEVRFTVPGTPVPKGRPRCSCRGGTPRMRTPEPTRVYERAVAMCAAAAGVRRLAGLPVEVDVVVVVPRLSRTAKSRPWREPHASRPDLDNYIKAVLDGVFSADGMEDGRVVRLSAEGWRAALGEEPHVEVAIRAWDAQGVDDGQG